MNDAPQSAACSSISAEVVAEGKRTDWVYMAVAKDDPVVSEHCVCFAGALARNTLMAYIDAISRDHGVDVSVKEYRSWFSSRYAVTMTGKRSKVDAFRRDHRWDELRRHDSENEQGREERERRAQPKRLVDVVTEIAFAAFLLSMIGFVIVALIRLAI